MTQARRLQPGDLVVMPSDDCEQIIATIRGHLNDTARVVITTTSGGRWELPATTHVTIYQAPR